MWGIFPPHQEKYVYCCYFKVCSVCLFCYSSAIGSTSNLNLKESERSDKSVLICIGLFIYGPPDVLRLQVPFFLAELDKAYGSCSLATSGEPHILCHWVRQWDLKRETLLKPCTFGGIVLSENLEPFFISEAWASAFPYFLPTAALQGGSGRGKVISRVLTWGVL